MAQGHALYLASASSAARSLACPGWSALSYFYRDELQELAEAPSDYADLGTDGHAVLESLIKKEKPPKRALKVVKADTGRTLNAVYFAYKTIKALIKKKGGKYISEADVKIFPKYEFRGQVDFTLFNGKELITVDYKNGVGVPVYVKDNWQGISYTWGRFRGLTVKQQAKVKKFTIGIIQPRCTQVEPVQFITYKRKQFFALVKQLQTGIGNCHALLEVAKHTNQPPYTVNLNRSDKTCQFCIAKSVCPQWHKPIAKVVDRYKDDCEQGLGAGYPTLKGKDLEELLIDAQGISSYLSELEKMVALRQQKHPDKSLFKIVEGRGRRVLTGNASEQIIKWHKKGKITKDQFNASMSYTPTTLTELSAALGSDKLSKIVKANKGKPTLVPKTDPRQSTTTTTNEKFDKWQKTNS